MNTTLMQILVDTIVFLEMSGEDVINPDAAVRQMESIAFLLKSLSADERQVFLGFVREQAGEREDPEVREFLRSFPQTLGLE